MFSLLAGFLLGSVILLPADDQVLFFRRRKLRLSGGFCLLRRFRLNKACAEGGIGKAAGSRHKEGPRQDEPRKGLLQVQVLQLFSPFL